MNGKSRFAAIWLLAGIAWGMFAASLPAQTHDLWILEGPAVYAPRVLSVRPRNQAILGSVQRVTAVFDQSLEPSSVGPAGFQIFSSGPDQVLNSADDILVAAAGITYSEGTHSVEFRIPGGLAPGWYRGRISAPIKNLHNQAMTAPHTWSFWVFAPADSDNDGVPDDLEAQLGTDPNNPDSNGNGTEDGWEDWDNDGLPNAVEILIGTDPKNPDTDNDGILDGAEDADHDDLPNAGELPRGLNPIVPDCDLDQWPDGVEVLVGSDPLDPDSVPKLAIASAPPVRALLPGFGEGAALAMNTIMSSPRVSVIAPALETEGDMRLNTIASVPPTRLLLPALDSSGGLGANTVVSNPRLSVILPFMSAEGANTTVSRPPVEVILPSLSQAGQNTTVARPPVSVQYQP